MKKRVILILCVLAVLLTAVICLPFARKIDTTVTATEYRFNDPAYAVEHTVVIHGHDTRNLLGYGVFEGTFAVSGFESGQEGWTFRVSFSDKKSLGTAFSRRPNGETCTRDLFHLRADRDWSDFAGLIMEVSDKAGHTSTGNFDPDTGRFLVSGPADREAAVAKAAALFRNPTGTACFKDNPTDITEAGRTSVRPRLLYIQLLLEHFSASMASTSISARRASAGFTTSMT